MEEDKEAEKLVIMVGEGKLSVRGETEITNSVKGRRKEEEEGRKEGRTKRM